MSWADVLWHRARQVGKTTALVEAVKKLNGILVCVDHASARRVHEQHGIDCTSIDGPDRMRGGNRPILFEPEAVAAVAAQYDRALQGLREQVAELERRLQAHHTLQAPNMPNEELRAIEQRAREGVQGIDSEGGGPSGAAYETCATDVPALVAEVRRLQAKLEGAQ